MAKIIDGKAISLAIKDELKEKVAEYKNKGIDITLAVVKVGNDPASAVYVRNKEKACEYVGINSRTLALPEEITQEKLLNIVRELNEDDTVNGILVQLPLPKHIDESEVLLAINSTKDVDGFHPVNVGKMVIGEDTFLPCTPAGIIEMLKRSDIDIEGKECVVIGRSNIVGKPMSLLMLKENATVTIAHSRTKDLKEVTKRADILVAAIGKPKFVTADYVKEGAVVIDVGMDRDENGKLCGDVDFESVEPKVSAITPVPGGVGPMTVTMLLVNCLRSVELNKK
ncbi:bifunctional methylenetetrahydrofolate dehydrogenase/methenyltetrahydrofolate cyclohydrolase FolD [Eubacterium sp. AF15-50]|uniref:bifunctional methylenetetrahydrofolate dehydrogenase/methenyltetrahydrofolate cyclohydrolase FolD n=1 Tax=Eubacterium sp. AF15-50 TaxID=2293103 RepID=UPI002673893E|nr:bifunctional methylenetetrahydrofolate dehydrogenase/methenyltetrahydrofolate cyclohydrolase FolD [Eubacterium sp. AF15-50]